MLAHLHLCCPLFWVQRSRRQPLPVTVQDPGPVWPRGTRARSRTSLEGPGSQAEQHEDQGRGNGPTLRHFKRLPAGGYVANSLKWHVLRSQDRRRTLLVVSVSATPAHPPWLKPRESGRDGNTQFPPTCVRHPGGVLLFRSCPDTLSLRGEEANAKASSLLGCLSPTNARVFPAWHRFNPAR